MGWLISQKFTINYENKYRYNNKLRIEGEDILFSSQKRVCYYLKNNLKDEKIFKILLFISTFSEDVIC